MQNEIPLWLTLVGALALSALVSYLITPPVKTFAQRLGAMDVPDEERHRHASPVPRMGGLAIFLGIVMTLLVFSDISDRLSGLMTGALLIVLMGTLDDMMELSAPLKLVVQIVAALIAYRNGIVLNVLSNPGFSSARPFFDLGWLSMPLTVLWIVGCTNAVNLIDGLDGLAAGVSAISSLTMLVVAVFVSEPEVAIILAAITGACIGFIPYNLSPAKIFMGDVGSQFLGYMLATVSMLGMIKLHAIVTFLVPVLAMGLPLADTVLAFFRRVFHGQSPFHADAGHIHHRLMALGYSQKQTVFLLYGVSALLGLMAVFMAGKVQIARILCIGLSFGVSLFIWWVVLRRPDRSKAREDARAVRRKIRKQP